MTVGRLIALVGPSGVGKDSVLQALSASRPEMRLVRRAITRAPGLVGEAYEAVCENEFESRQAAGDFCLSWEAHGLNYGIPATVLTGVRNGTDYLVNLSREVLIEADRLFPRLIIINLTADPEVLAARLSWRGRENAGDTQRRLARAVADFASHLNVTTVSNDGPLEDTVAEVQALLDTEIVEPEPTRLSLTSTDRERRDLT